MKRTRVLVVDDELSILKFLRANLENHGFEVLTAVNGSEGLRMYETELPDIVILDILMPEMSGFTVCDHIREWSQVPIIMLSARDNSEDKIRCLNLGADDYVTKPFNSQELVARVNAVMRRVDNPAVPVRSSFQHGELDINFTSRRVKLAEKDIRLTPTEYNLLVELVQNKGKVLTHAHLLSKIWGDEYVDDIQYLHVFARRLRSKLEPDPINPVYILTIPRVGYQFMDT